MVSSSVNRLVAAFWLLLITAGFGFGQQSGSISGTVTDADFGILYAEAMAAPDDAIMA